jgi:DNA polymerase V
MNTATMKLTRICKTDRIDFYTADLTTSLELPMAPTMLSAGFPSPAEDHLELKLDLNRALVRHPNATFYGRVKGSSMIEAGIDEGDILVIDKSLDPKEGDIAVCFIDGEFTVKRISKKDDGLYLIPANSEFRPKRIEEESEFQIWGIVTYVIHKTR